MSSEQLRLMAVHTHPGDAASSTGGVFARDASEGARPVLATCTDGRSGDGRGGTKPRDADHNPVAVAARRQGELERSAGLLSISDVELLGSADSGMAGWASNDAPGAFWAAPVDQAAARLAVLMRRYPPDVVGTYGERGLHGHPAHVQANRVTMAALDLLTPGESPATTYWTTTPSATMRELGRRMRASGVDWDLVADDEHGIGLRDDEITTWVDVRAFAEAKYRALAAHASQPDNANFLTLDLATFTELLGVETFVRVRDRRGDTTSRESDLFAGLR